MSDDISKIQKLVSGNLSFERLLRKTLGEEQPPVKNGKNKIILALASTDSGREQMLNHENGRVRELMRARIAVRSWPLHQRRVQGIVRQAKACGGFMPMGLNYYGAKTGRWSGSENVNVQNLPARSEYALVNQIRGLLTAPPGHVLVITDAAQIEARNLAWQAGQDDLVAAFAGGREIYCEFASEVLGSRIRKPRSGDPSIVVQYLKHYRQFGKIGILGCLAEGTPILTDNGWKPIERVQIYDLVWEGERWVSHAGVVYQGEQECQNVHGVWMTPDHEVHHDGGWYQGQDLLTHNLKWETATANLQYPRLYVDREAGLSPSNVLAPVVEFLLRAATIWSPENLRGVMSVLKKRLLRRIHDMGLCRSRIVLDFVTAFVRSLVDATHAHIPDTGDGESVCTLPGWKIDICFTDTLCHYRDGITPLWRSIGLTTTETTNPEISGSLPEPRTCRTYDIVQAGSNRRFQAGPLLVANCGYGMGVDRCLQYARDVFHIDIARPLAEKIVGHYREKYRRICKLWGDVERAFKYVVRYPSETCELDHGLTFCNDEGTVILGLPSGRALYYHDPYIAKDDRGRDQLCMPDERKTGAEIRMWGGYLVENIIQATSRDILGDAILILEGIGYPVALHAHDEVILVVPEAHGEAALAAAIKTLSQTPIWCPGMPLDAEGTITDRYGK